MAGGLNVKGLRKSFGGREVVRGIGLACAAGKILAILGPSGSGKTSLLRLIAGLEPPDAGEVFLDGREVTSLPPHKRRMGFMFQDLALFPQADVFGNVAFGLKILGLPASEISRRARAALELVGLSGFEKRAVDQLSGGERQRVALARSLAPEPGLVMLDEPLGSLDRRLRERLAGELRQILKASGAAAIFVTHDQSEALAVGDEIAVLLEGEIAQCAPPEELWNAPADAGVAAFLGLGNLLDVTGIHSGRVSTPIGEFPAPGGGPAGKIMLLRPDAARLAEAGDGDLLSIEGRVSGISFLGRGYRIKLTGPGDTPLAFELPPTPRPPGAGEKARLVLDLSRALLLPGKRSKEGGGPKTKKRGGLPLVDFFGE